jgi:hypothetical protein
LQIGAIFVKSNHIGCYERLVRLGDRPLRRSLSF